MKQEHRYPYYYKEFRCIAAACEDSCCAGWQIVVDDESAAQYQSVPGEIGDTLRSVMMIDEDGDRVFRLNNDNCPFWETSGLCAIHRQIGETYLCKTCREFPRAVQDYGVFAEHDLSLSCPEAARHILKGRRPLEYTEMVEVPDEACGYSEPLMNFLLEARERLYDMIWNPAHCLAHVLADCLLYAEQLQEYIDNEKFEIAPEYQSQPWEKPVQKGIGEDFFAPFAEMEILTEDWKQLLEDAEMLGDLCPWEELQIQMAGFDNQYRRMLHYYLSRYWLQTVADYDAVGKIKLMTTAFLMLRRMQTAYMQKKKELPESASMRLVQLYSKEVEHNALNRELLEEAFFTEESFSIDHLIQLLCQW